MCKKNLGHRGPSSLCRCLAAFVSLVLLCCGGPMALAADSLEELREKLFRTEDAPRPEAAARDFQFESVLAFIDENISRDLTNEDCTDYAYEYLEYDFARGMYGDAALELTQALERWYETYFD